MNIFMIVLLSLEILFLITFLIMYVWKEKRIAKYEKENRKLAIKEILEGAKDICDDNIRLTEKVMVLKIENQILKETNKELEEKCKKSKKKTTKK